MRLEADYVHVSVSGLRLISKAVNIEAPALNMRPLLLPATNNLRLAKKYFSHLLLLPRRRGGTVVNSSGHDGSDDAASAVHLGSQQDVTRLQVTIKKTEIQNMTTKSRCSRTSRRLNQKIQKDHKPIIFSVTADPFVYLPVMTVLWQQGRILVSGSGLTTSSSSSTGTTSINGDENDIWPILASDVSLSFWGGIDPVTGVVIDTSHPWCGHCVKDCIMVLPSGRGSCTASQVLLELILNGKGPRAIVLRDCDGLVCVGALVAQTMFEQKPTSEERNGDGSSSSPLVIPTILQLDQTGDFETLLEQIDGACSYYGVVTNRSGHLVRGSSISELTSFAEEWQKLNDHSILEVNSEGSKIYSPTEQEMLAQTQTVAERRAMGCVIAYGRIVTPPSDEVSYIPVSQAHIDGCTYIGPGGLELVQRLVAENGQVRIPTTLNSVSTDLRFWKTLGMPESSFNINARRLADAYVELGCSDQSFTCAPYLLPATGGASIPKMGDQLVWGESNAVVYANSVLGARTEKYADYLDICGALTGYVPNVGVHLEQNRQPRILLDVRSIDYLVHSVELDSYSLLFPVLGHLCGSLSDGLVPLLVGLEDLAPKISQDHLKALCAAFGTTTASPLIHIAGVTPEAKTNSLFSEEAFLESDHRHNIQMIKAEQLEHTFQALNQQLEASEGGRENKTEETHKSMPIDWVALGNPHLSLSECEELSRLVQELPAPQIKQKDVQLLACISRALYDQVEAATLQRLEGFGMRFVRDTCWCMLLETPMIPANAKATVLTNSGKYAHYGPGLTGRRYRLGSLAECVTAAHSGRLASRNQLGGQLPWHPQKHQSGNGSHVRPEQSAQLLWSTMELMSNALPPGTSVAVFGSSASGFGSPKSDLDMCLQIPQSALFTNGEDAMDAMATVANTLANHGVKDVDVSRLTARIPVIKFNCPKPLRGENADEEPFMECDLSMHNPLAVLNTPLLRTYAEINPIPRVLVGVIKRWAKARDINNPARHTLSSYGYILMLLHFLTFHKRSGNGLVVPLNKSDRNQGEQQQRPLMPNLLWMDPQWPQMPSGTAYREQVELPRKMMKHPMDDKATVHTYFYRPQPSLLEHLQRVFPGQDLSLGILLASFFRYYAYECRARWLAELQCGPYYRGPFRDVL